jgi:membrane associated rhomboid family serine protease
LGNRYTGKKTETYQTLRTIPVKQEFNHIDLGAICPFFYVLYCPFKVIDLVILYYDNIALNDHVVIDHLMKNSITDTEEQSWIKKMYIPIYIVLIMWVVKIFETITGLDLAFLGILPRKLQGIPGIFLTPFIHGDFKHLANNTLPFILLTAALFYFYKEIAFKVFVLSWLMSGIWIWLGARPAYHIGASGLIYAYAAFLFVSGIIRNYIPLMAISLLVVFLYGSMVWYLFPIDFKISWESHLMGSIAGVTLAFYYKKFGPQREKYDWENEEELNEETIEDSSEKTN